MNGRLARAAASAGYRTSVVSSWLLDPTKQPDPAIELVMFVRPRSRARRFTTAQWHILQACRKTNAQVFHLHDPDLISIGLILKLLGKRVVYDVHEDYRMKARTKSWLPKWARPLATLYVIVLEWLAATFFDGFTTASEYIARYFPARRTRVVRNLPNLEHFAAAEPLPFNSRPNMVGTFGMVDAARCHEEILAALQDRRLEGVEFRVAGPVRPDLERSNFVRRLEAAGGKYLGFMRYGAMLEELRACRICFALYRPLPDYRVVDVSGKMLDAMALEVPVVVGSGIPALRRLVERVGCGVVVDEGRPEAIADAMYELLKEPERAAEMGRRGRKAVVEELNWQNEMRKLQELYGQILGSRSARNPKLEDHAAHQNL
ncbi:MAG: glycosyltransferase [Proteobacteria bacterium]|nr:glycosyltransferase [Pseudomonadota bacterium]